MAGPGLERAWTFELKRGEPAPPAPAPDPPPEPGPATALAALKLSASSAFGSGTVDGTVTLDGLAPAGGATVALASNRPHWATVPATVTVPEGSATASFTVTVTPRPLFGQVTISGEYGGVTQGGLLGVAPSEQAIELDGFGGGLTVSTKTPLGGEIVQGTVTLSSVAPPGGAIVALGSTNPALASVPASVTVPEGAKSASFSVTTQPVAEATKVTILASRSWTLGVTLELLPEGSLASLQLSQTIVEGGTPVEATVTLAGAAPAGGVVVSLSSSNTAVATLPASVTVPAGASRATFTITTSSPAAPAISRSSPPPRAGSRRA